MDDIGDVFAIVYTVVSLWQHSCEAITGTTECCHSLAAPRNAVTALQHLVLGRVEGSWLLITLPKYISLIH